MKSLRTKILLLLAVTGFGTSFILLYFSISIFKNDKTAYIFDTNEAYLESTVTQFRNDLEIKKELVRQRLNSFRHQKSLALADEKELDEADPIDGLQLLNRKGTEETLVSEIYKTPETDRTKRLFAQVKPGQALRFYGSDIVVTETFTEGENEAVLNYAFKSAALKDFFEAQKSFSAMIVNSQKQVVLGDSAAADAQGAAAAEKIVAEAFNLNSAISKNSSESRLVESGGQKYLFTSVYMGYGDYYLVSVLNEKAAFSAVQMLITRAVLFFIFVTAVLFIIAYIFSNYLTEKLSRLAEAAARVAQGDFDFSVPVSGRDEIATLTSSFNRMSAEIANLIVQTRHKARMESELQTAKLVQATLFPAPDHDSDFASLKAICLSASECGGDWWHYFESEDSLWIWMADATGHGAPAALLTSAAKSAVSLIEKTDMELPAAMSQLNYAISSVARENMMMTCFLARIDKKTLNLRYCSASHEPVVVLRKSEKIDKGDLQFLDGSSGVRLGENAGSIYEEAQIQLGAGDRLVFYTDGVNDVKTASGKALGERGFFKMLIESYNHDAGFSGFFDFFRARLTEHAGDRELPDDVTLCFLEIKNVV